MLRDILPLTGPLGPLVSMAQRGNAELHWLACLQASDIPALVALLRMPVDTLGHAMRQSGRGPGGGGERADFPWGAYHTACLQAFDDLLPAAMTNAALVKAMGYWRHPGLLPLYHKLLEGTEDTAVVIASASAFSELPKAEAVPLLQRLDARFGHEAAVADEIKTAYSVLEINSI